MCGVTTGGKAECEWDCKIVTSNSNGSGQVSLENPECFDDCFTPDHCVSLFLQDFKAAGGTCYTSPTASCQTENLDFASVNFSDPCTFINPFGKIINEGICSVATEVALKTESCYLDTFTKSRFLFGAFSTLLYSSCSQEVLLTWCGRETNPNFRSANPEDISSVREELLEDNRINPVSLVGQLNSGGFVKTELDFENTKHRYSWICSLRGKTHEKLHFCAVTLLRRPPGPTVMVTTAHCTYLCKNGDDVVDNCCCDNIR